MRELIFTLTSGDQRDSHAWVLTERGELIDTALWQPRIPGGVTVTFHNSSTGAWELHLTAASVWSEDVAAEVRIPLSDSLRPSHALHPMYQGIIERYACTTARSSEYRSAGRPTISLRDDQRIGLPFVVLENSGGYWLAGTDPTFSTTIATTANGAEVIFAWRWLAQAGLHADERRRLFILPAINPRAALEAWFAAATPDIPPGADWLQDIALTNYDYLSKDGMGWFADIDAACAMIAPADRHRAIFCLHGWYDRLGRYCFDPVRRQLDAEWVAFPYIHDPALLARQGVTFPESGIPYSYTFRNLTNYHPLTLNWANLRERLTYAKTRGLRTAFYLTCGMQTIGDPAAAIADGTGLDTPHSLWVGPDMIGQTYLLNPLHPDVRGWFLAYTKAVLEKVGDLIDALVLDEAYYIGYGTLAPAACPGYADRGQMALVRDISRLCHQVRPDLAFLTADHMGTYNTETRALPYSLFADGIYHDAWCTPQSWDACLFPTWRNVTWSCNWSPVTHFNDMRLGVLKHNAPLALGHGCWGDDIGLANMEAPLRQQIAGLWHIRTSRQRDKLFTVVDVR